MMFAFDHAVEQDPVHDAPAIVGMGLDQPPTGEIATVEQGDGSAEFHLLQVRSRRQGWNAETGELRAAELLAILHGLHRDETHLVTGQGGGDRFRNLFIPHLAGGILALLPAHAGHDQMVALDLGAGHRHHAATTP